MKDLNCPSFARPVCEPEVSVGHGQACSWNKLIGDPPNERRAAGGGQLSLGSDFLRIIALRRRARLCAEISGRPGADQLVGDDDYQGNQEGRTGGGKHCEHPVEKDDRDLIWLDRVSDEYQRSCQSYEVSTVPSHLAGGLGARSTGTRPVRLREA